MFVGVAYIVIVFSRHRIERGHASPTQRYRVMECGGGEQCRAHVEIL